MSRDDLRILLGSIDELVRIPQGIEGLRQNVLRLAVSGQLVSRLDGDEMSQIYVERVQERNAAAPPSKKLAKNGVVPTQGLGAEWWHATLLGQIAKDVSYGTSKRTSDSGEVPVLRMGNIQHRKLDLTSLKYLPREADLTPLMLQPGDLLFNRTNSPALVGKAAVYDQGGEFTFASYLIRVRFDDEVNPEFVSLWLASPYGREWARRVRTDAIGQSNINGTLLGAFPLSLPSRAEQDRIVHRVATILNLVDNLQAVHQEAEESRATLATTALNRLGTQTDQFAMEYLHELVANPSDVKHLDDAVLELAMRGRLNTRVPKRADAHELEPDQDAFPFPIPSTWKWEKLSTVADYVQRGKSPRYVDASQYPVISQKCVRWSGLDWSVAKFIDPPSLSGYTDERFLVDGDLLINSTGTGTLGRVCIYRPTPEFERVVADGHVTVVRLSEMLPEFVCLWLRSPWIQSTVESNASGSTNQIEWNVSVIRNEWVPVPPIEEQLRIVEAVQTLLDKTEQLRLLVS